MTSTEAMAIFHSDLYALLDRQGPCTKTEIKRILRWGSTRATVVLASQPEWLVVVAVHRAESKFGRLAMYHCRGEHILGVCSCGRKNFHPALKNKKTCLSCLSRKPPRRAKKRTVPGVDVSLPTNAMPSTELKLQILAARLDAGLPLHIPGDERFVNPGWNESQEEHDEDE